MRALGVFFCHLGKTVDVSLVYELVVRGSGAALVDAEEALLGNIYYTESIQKEKLGQ